MTERDKLTELNNETENRVLSIDGGGIRGIIAVTQLAKLEKELNMPAAQVFSVMGGTSTGSLITAGLAIGVEAKDIERMYLDDGPKAFQRDWIGFIRSLGTVQYQSEPLLRMIRSVTEQKLLSDLPVGVLFPVVRFSDSKLINLTNGSESDTRNVLVSDAVMASSAAPLYFSAHSIPGIGECYDGGVSGVAGNPVLIVSDYVFKNLVYEEGSTQVISLGTGRYVGPNSKNHIFELAGWTIDNLFRGPAEQQTSRARELYSQARIVRIDADLTQKIGMDDINSIPTLKRIADELAEKIKWTEILGLGKSVTSIHRID